MFPSSNPLPGSPMRPTSSRDFRKSNPNSNHTQHNKSTSVGKTRPHSSHISNSTNSFSYHHHMTDSSEPSSLSSYKPELLRKLEGRYHYNHHTHHATLQQNNNNIHSKSKVSPYTITDLSICPSSSQATTNKKLLIASGCYDGSFTLWSFCEKKNVNVRAYRFETGHTKPITCIKFNSDSNVLATSSQDKSIRLYLNFNKKENNKRDMLNSIIMSNQQKEEDEDMYVLKGAHSSQVNHLDLTTNEDNLLLSCSNDKTIKLFSQYGKRFQQTFTGHSHWVNCCKFCPNSSNRLIGSCGEDGCVKLWDVEHSSNNKNIMSSSRYSGSGNGEKDFMAKTWSSSGTQASMSSSAVIHTYKEHSHNHSRDRAGVAAGINVIEFAHNGTSLISGSSENGIRIYDLRTHQIMQHYKSTKKVRKVSCVKDYYLLASSPGSFKMCDIRIGKVLYEEEEKCNDEVNTVSPYCSSAFSSDGSIFACNGFYSSTSSSTSLDSNIFLYKSPLHSDDNSGSHTVVKKRNVNKKKDNDDMISPPTASSQPKHQKHTSSPRESNKKITKDFLLLQKEQPNKPTATEMDFVSCLNHVVTQLEIVVQTLSMLDQRLRIQEENMAKIITEKEKENEQDT